MVISRFLGRWPNDSMIFGDNKGSPERKRVAFAVLPKEGGPSVVGGKYSEVIIVGAFAEIQVVGEEETERSAGDGEERRTGLYTPKGEMNQILEHSVVSPSFIRSRASSTFRGRLRWMSSPLTSSIFSHITPGKSRSTFSHTHPPSFSRLAAPRKPNRAGLILRPRPFHDPQTGSRCRPQSPSTSNAEPSNPSLTTNSPPTVVWRLPLPAQVRMTLRALDRWSVGRIWK